MTGPIYRYDPNLVSDIKLPPHFNRIWFAADFRAWADERSPAKPFTIIDDGSTDNESRLGAVGDVQLVLHEAGGCPDGAYVLATDNLPKFDLRDIVGVAEEKGTAAVFACLVQDRAELTRMGVAELDADGLIVSFEEKPERPRGRFRVPPFYVYPPDALAGVDEFLAAGNNPDAPGHFLAWLAQRQPVHAARRDEGTHDIGTLESYRRVCEELGESMP